MTVWRYQWSNGNQLEIAPLTDDVYSRWIRRLLPELPKQLKDLDARATHFAKHRTGDPGFEVAEARWEEQDDGRSGRLPLVQHRLFKFVDTTRIFIDRQGWWIGPHVAEPKPHLYVLTPPVGLLVDLQPPAMSRRWVKRVATWDRPRR